MKTSELPEYMKPLVKEFRSQLDAKVDVERISPGHRYRFALTSPKFQRMPHLKRQDRIWQIVNTVLDRDKSLKITLILAYAPSELEVGTARARRRKGAVVSR